jgi:hypothetical protein
MTIRKSQYEKIWDELDESMSIIMSGETEASKKEREKIYAKALAFALATFSHVGLDSVEAITKEALARYKMRTGKIPFRPTQGYVFSVEKANYSPEAYAAAKGEAAATRERAEATSGYSNRSGVHEIPKNKLSDKQQAAIKAGLSGGMSPKDLASLYHVPLSAVEALV